MHLKLLFLAVFVASPFVHAKTVKGPAPAMPAAPASANTSPSEGPWKGKSPDAMFQFSGLAGLSRIGSNVGFGLNGLAAIRMLQDGFIDGINDQVFVEFMMGPIFLPGATMIALGGHLRWDLHRDEFWAFYGLAGFHATVGSTVGLGTFNFRSGIGAFWNLFEFLSFRAELSHEHMAVGVTYHL